MLTSGALDAAEERELRAHLATGCPTCAGYLAEAQAVWSQIPMGLAPVAPSSAAKDMLMIKVDATGPQRERGPIPISEGVSPVKSPPARRWSSFGVTGVAAAVGIAITYFTMRAMIDQQDETIRQLSEQVTQRDKEYGERQAQVQDLTEQVRSANSVINMLKNPTTQVVKFGPPDAAMPMPAARMLWDPKENAGMFVGSMLKPAAPGRVYELWVIVGDKPADKLAAGTIAIDERGDAMLHINWKGAVNPVKFAVTDEPMRENITDPQGPATMVGQM